MLGVLMAIVGCTPDNLSETPAELTAPAGVKLVSSDESSLTFSWDEMKGASYYVVRLATESGSFAPGGQTTTKTNTVTFRGLAAYTTYVFTVKARVGDVESPVSEPLSAATVEGGSSDPGTDPGDNPGQDPGDNPEITDAYAEFKVPAVEDSHKSVLAFPGAEGGGNLPDTPGTVGDRAALRTGWGRTYAAAGGGGGHRH